jgi:hypothetical protein
MTESYTAGEERILREEMAKGAIPSCPRCGAAMIRTPITPRSDVAYVRTRYLLQCQECELRAVLDRK